MQKTFLSIVAAMFLASFLVAWPADAGAPLDVDMMKAALRTETAEENGFIDRVSDLVVKDVLPRDMVDSTFLWARKKADHKFQYFKRGLKRRAKEIGVKL